MTYYFNVNKWFAVEHGDGKVEREIPVLESMLTFAEVSRVTVLPCNVIKLRKKKTG